VPLSHPFVEHLIGTIRRELLDQVFFWNAGDLEQKLAAFRRYYNTHRSHPALEGATPAACCEKRKIQLADLNRGPMQIPLLRPISAALGCLSSNSP
jgi:hypothetical protein